MITGNLERVDLAPIAAANGRVIFSVLEIPDVVAREIVFGSISVYLDTEGVGTGAMTVQGMISVTTSSRTDFALTEAIEIGAGSESGWFALHLDEPLCGERAATFRTAFLFTGDLALNWYGVTGDTDGDYADGVTTLEPSALVSDGNAPKALCYATFAEKNRFPYETDLYYARLPFHSAQAAIGRAGPVPPAYRGTAGWHGTALDTESQGSSFAIVHSGREFAGLLGQRVKVTYRNRSVYAYIHKQLDLDTDEDISLSRRLFQHLAPLSTDSLSVRVEALGEEN